MDTVTRRSAVISTVLHAGLVAMAFWPRGCGCSHTPPEPSASAGAPAPTAAAAAIAPAPAKPTPAPLRLVLEPLPEPPAPLPSLTASGQPSLPKELVELITPANTDRPGRTSSRGHEGTAPISTELPRLPANDADLIAQLRGKALSNEAMSRDEKQLRDAQEHLDFLLDHQLKGPWHHLLRQLTENRLVIEIAVDSRGRIKAGQLLNSSGSPELDRAIDDWLQRGEVTLPPIHADRRYPFLVIVRR